MSLFLKEMAKRVVSEISRWHLFRTLKSVNCSDILTDGGSALRIVPTYCM